ncbi:tetratricopeptide repeat protein [Actinokineospora auranticolor]|uniref:tetratricopeptide repeat protein n=1 Tax=Actinokineospora auranticolor TaxID=155976 RepID=UPI0015E496A7|nr:tetratricopeptide repeat protein [Actinokineospora auranticolor]
MSSDDSAREGADRLDSASDSAEDRAVTEPRQDSPRIGVVNSVMGEVSGLLVQAGRIEGGVHQHHHAAARATVSFPHRAGPLPLRAASFQRRALSGSLAPLVDTIVLSGMGGTGKTQLAAEYAERAWTAGEVDLLVWVSAGTRDAVISGYARVAADVTGVEDARPDDGARRFLDWLASTSMRWLVVLDDVRIPADLVELWPASSTTGQVVVTTRRRDAALQTQGRVVEVEPFTSAEAEAYLASVVEGRRHLLDGGIDLITALGCLPLALAQAATYMLDRELSCTAYMKRLADHRVRLATVLPEREALPDAHQATVAATWSLSIELADRLAPAGLASPLLDVAALLSPDGIPVDLFSTPSVVSYLGEQAGWAVNGQDVQDGLRCLHRVSLAVLDGPVVRVHGLVQRAARDDVAPDKLPTLARVAADGLLHLWPDLVRNSPLTQVLRANADSLATNCDDHLWHDGAHEVLFRAASSLGATGMVTSAVSRFRLLHSAANHRLGPDHADTLATRSEAAHWQGEAGDSTGAVRALTELLSDRTRVLGPDHPDALTTRNDLAHWQARAGNVHDAIRTAQELVLDQTRLLGADAHATLVTRANLTTWLRHTDQATHVPDTFDDLLDDLLRVLGADHELTLKTQANHAITLAESDDPSLAIPLFDELLPNLVRVLGPDHPTALDGQLAAAAARGQAGDPAGAAAGFEDLLADHLRVLGPDHPKTLMTRHNIAHWTAEAGDPAEATQALDYLLPDMLRVLGADHPYTLASRYALATVRGQAGDPNGAIAAFEELLHDQKRVFGADHPQTLDIRGTIALWRKETGDLPGAIATLETLQPDQQRVLGPEHPTTLITREAIDMWRALLG